MTPISLKNQLFGDSHNVKSSFYVDYNGMTVRISDHLPQDHNVRNNHEIGSKLFFVFTDSDFSYSEAEKHLEKTLGYDFDYDFVIFEEGDDLEMIKKLIDRHS